MLRSQPLTTVEVRLLAPPPSLPADLQAEIDVLWAAERARRGAALFDGQIFSIHELALPLITGGFVPYRSWMAQRRRTELYEILRVRPLAVSGLLRCADGIVFGRRSGHTTDHPAQWELVPSGGIEPACVESLRADPLRQILREAEEEIGLSGEDISALGVFCLIEDGASHVVDLGITLASPCSATALSERHRTRGSDEYAALTVVAEEDLTEYLATRGDGLVAASAEMLRLWRRSSL